MGFRCPNCGKDFGNDQSKLKDHLSNEVDCYSQSNFELMKVEFNSNILVDKKNRTHVYTDEGMYKSLDIAANNTKREYDFIGDHDWQKLNIVSKSDGTDDLKCRRCGLLAISYFGQIKPNKKF